MIGIESIACAFPEKYLTNADLRADYPEWDFDRLETRTGVMKRHVAAEGETALDFAVQACESLAERGAPAG